MSINGFEMSTKTICLRNMYLWRRAERHGGQLNGQKRGSPCSRGAASYHVHRQIEGWIHVRSRMEVWEIAIEDVAALVVT
ncbi:hypothetical protein HBI56_128470 [Parastagonospora nodorum]|nr:hypothetical protein HBH56_155390 [Parastagonospora nodorum]KAH3926624.1 hypothetical protein HBH54_162300 [Parastagonospora nodorum]KAH3943155.1 hypothetical protein HBH53_176850 [Parastagonospora nodorum]KAH3970313.1 hypothetical protein HBH52_168570 [Parastagonospora nodorum]KAH3972097.1 hypothetical protein HBH51_104630 [Parastagonospora nodorum]